MKLFVILAALIPVSATAAKYAIDEDLAFLLEPVSNLRCPDQFDNRVTWSSSATEFFYAVAPIPTPPASCMDASNPYTNSKEALLPSETGTYNVKVCAYDSDDNIKSEEKSITCSIQVP